MAQKRKSSSLNIEKDLRKVHISDVNDNVSNISNHEVQFDENHENGYHGIIETMVLKNFMCHSHLKIDFNSRVNFLIGRNGSGKSAILTALVIGLGGRAVNTNRGKSIREFIKAGQMVSAIEITLSNCGPEAYHPSTYGRKITIIRQFSANTSSYKIKNENNFIISTSAKDVNAIREAFNIQVDNPICLLNQDISRSFLNNKDPKKKYELFMAATNLDEVSDYYTKMKQEQEQIEKLRTMKTQDFNELEQKLKVYKNKLKQTKLYSSYKVRLEELIEEKFWCEYKDLCDKKATLEHEEQDKLEQRHRIVERIDGFNEFILRVQDEIKSLNIQIEDIKNSSKEIDDQSKETRNKYFSLEQEYKLKKSELKELTYNIESQRNTRDSLLKRIDGLDERNKKIEEQKLMRDRQMGSLKTELEEINAQLISKNEELNQRLHSYDIANNKLKEMIGTKNATETKIRSIENLVKTLQKNQNPLTIYGSHVPQLLQLLDHNKDKFSSLPKGPIGSFITVKKPEWILAIENIFSPKLLRGFIVASHKDHKTFVELFKKNFPRERVPQILITPFENAVYDYGLRMAEEVPNTYLCIKMLDITDPVVMNCLIDQYNIESILLFNDEQQCMQRLSRKENLPLNCRMAVTISGNSFYPTPLYRTYSAQVCSAQCLQANISTMIEEKLNEINVLRHQREQQQQNVNICNADVQSQLRDRNGLMNEVRALEKNRSIVSSKHDKLETLILDEPLQDTKLLETLENIKQQITELELKITNLTEQVQLLEHTLEEQKKKEMELKQTSRDILDRIEPLKRQIVQHEADLSKKNNDVNRYQLLLKKHDSSSAERSSTIKKLETEIAQLLNTAKSAPNENPRSKKDIEKEEKSLTHNIAMIDQDKSLSEDIETKYEEYQKKYDKYSNFFKMWSDTCELSVSLVMKRVNDHKILVQKIGETVRTEFSQILNLRGFKGDLHIDHNKKELHLQVQTPTNLNTSGDTRTLSGGERSYSTVSFIMALWKCVRFPFFFMDEFDVFMDKMNRKIVMDLLCANAKENIGVQYVFLTPVDTTITASDLISIHRMKDPNTGKHEEE